MNSAIPSRFELIRHLGSGGMGSVFEAFDHKLGEKVALKTVREGDLQALPFLKNEFRILADIRHENLVHLLELVEEHGRIYVVMELIDGEDLLSHFRPGAAGGEVTAVTVRSDTEVSVRFERSPNLTSPVAGDEGRLRATLAQLARALVQLHEHGKVHGDVKPQNILVTGAGRVVLVDFGLTRDELVPERSGRGTRAFMAPEQVAGQAVTSATDWYAFGVALYLVLTGELPFSGAELARKQLSRTPKIPPGHPSPELIRLAIDLLNPDPAARPLGSEVLTRLGSSAPLGRGQVPFVGRHKELERLFETFERSRQGFSPALVVGESGLGKTQLVREFLSVLVASRPHALVLSGRCYERELLPYKALDAIVDGLSDWLGQPGREPGRQFLPRDMAILARIFPVLAPLAAGVDFELRLDPTELRARAFAALRELLMRIATSRPVVLFIDDLQWADADSHLLLADLLRTPDAPPICLLATCRRLEQHTPNLRALTETWPLVEVSELNADDSGRVVEALLGEHASEELVGSVVREAQGHPLFLQALGSHVRSVGVFSPGSLRLEQALRASTETLERPARGLLELVAVYGGPVPSAVAERAAALSPLDFERALGALVVERLVRRGLAGHATLLEPYHDRIQEVVVRSLDAEKRRAVHAELAVALEALESGDSENLALVRHLEAAGRLEDAAERALRGAAAAERSLAFDQAAELYLQTLRLGSRATAAEVSVRRALAKALAAAGRASEAAQACLQLVPLVPLSEQVELRRQAADHLLRSGYLEQGSAILSQALREVGADLKSQRASLVSTLVGRAALYARGLDWVARRPEEVDAELLRRVDLFHAVGVSLALIDPVRGSSFEIRALRLALEVADPPRLVPILLMEAGYEASAGARGLVRASRLLEEARLIARGLGDDYCVAITRMMEGFLFFHAGDFNAALERLTAVEREFQVLPGRYFEQAFCHCFRLISARNAGQYAPLERGYEGWVRLAARRSDRFTEAVLRFNLNGVWLLRDDPDAAERDLDQVQWIPPRGGYHVQHWYETQARVEIALYRGHYAQALAYFRVELEQLSRSFILRMRLHRCHAHWLLGRILLLQAHDALEAARLKEVARLADRMLREDVGFAATWGRLLRAGAAARSGRRELVAEELLAAHAAAASAGMAHCVHTARYFLASYAGGPAFREGQGEALAWAREQGIQRPLRLLGTWGAGLGSDSDHTLDPN